MIDEFDEVIEQLKSKVSKVTPIYPKGCPWLGRDPIYILFNYAGLPWKVSSRDGTAVSTLVHTDHDYVIYCYMFIHILYSFEPIERYQATVDAVSKTYAEQLDYVINNTNVSHCKYNTE